MAGASGQHHHRATLSQSNKAFKSRFSSKGALKDASKGRVNKESPKQAPHTKVSASGQKAARRNHAKQIQAQKRRALVEAQRIFSGDQKAPRVVAVLGLCEDLDLEGLNVVARALESASGIDNVDGDEQMEGSSSRPFGLKDVKLPSNRFKSSSLQLLLLQHGTPLANIISALAGSDFLITVLSPTHECSAWGETVLRSIQAAGTATGVIGLVSTLEPVVPKEQTKTRASLLSFLHYFFPPASSTGHGLLLDKLIAADHPGELANVVRCLAEKAPREVAWREGRARLVAESVEWEKDDLLRVTGVVRGGPLSVDRLVHVPMLGDFRLKQITTAPALTDRSKRIPSSAMQVDEQEPRRVLATRNDAEADDLASSNVPSEGAELLNEQTWPTEEEMASAPVHSRQNGDALPPAAPGTTPKVIKRVPKGTSAYQAAWLLDDLDDDELSDEADENGDAPMDDAGSVAAVVEPEVLEDDEDDYEEVDMSNAAGPSVGKRVGFQDLPDDVEATELEAFRQRQRAREEREDAEFPDEIDTPLDVAASQRFARYRGLRSFRTSDWDPYENLPEDYAKLFGFEDWKLMSRKLLKRAKDDLSAMQPGARVSIHIEGVDRTAFSSLATDLPLVVFSLLRHEHKYSAMHFTAQRNTEYTETLKSKDDVVVCIGPRFFAARPLWSQHSQGRAGKGVNNVHKFERFLRPGAAPSVGTAYLPVTFGAVPVLVLKDGDETQLVATGTLLGSDVTRIIAKRIILTGHPYKVHKKTATIRYMFFNRPDVEYFKPVQLKTKKGKTGFIREPLGTHGYFKAGFDGAIDQMDTVCMNLYKRCFPKWASYWRPTVEQAADVEMQ